MLIDTDLFMDAFVKVIEKVVGLLPSLQSKLGVLPVKIISMFRVVGLQVVDIVIEERKTNMALGSGVETVSTNGSKQKSLT